MRVQMGCDPLLCGEPNKSGACLLRSHVILNTSRVRAMQHMGFPLTNVQAFLLGVVYVIFTLWRLSDILTNDLGGKTAAAKFTIFIKTRQVSGTRFLSLGSASAYPTAFTGGRRPSSHLESLSAMIVPLQLPFPLIVVVAVVALVHSTSHEA